MIPYVEASVIHNPEKNEVTVFAVNRSLTEDTELSMTFENFGNCILTEHIELYSDSTAAVNTKDMREIVPANVELTNNALLLKRHPWNMLRYQYVTA